MSPAHPASPSANQAPTGHHFSRACFPLLRPAARFPAPTQPVCFPSATRRHSLPLTNVMMHPHIQPRTTLTPATPHPTPTPNAHALARTRRNASTDRHAHARADTTSHTTRPPRTPAHQHPPHARECARALVHGHVRVHQVSSLGKGRASRAAVDADRKHRAERQVEKRVNNNVCMRVLPKRRWPAAPLGCKRLQVSCSLAKSSEKLTDKSNMCAPSEWRCAEYIS